MSDELLERLRSHATANDAHWIPIDVDEVLRRAEDGSSLVDDPDPASDRRSPAAIARGSKATLIFVASMAAAILLVTLVVTGRPSGGDGQLSTSAPDGSTAVRRAPTTIAGVGVDPATGPGTVPTTTTATTPATSIAVSGPSTTATQTPRDVPTTETTSPEPMVGPPATEIVPTTTPVATTPPAAPTVNLHHASQVRETLAGTNIAAPAGSFTVAADTGPTNFWGIAKGPDGAIWFTTGPDPYGNGSNDLSRVDPATGTVTTYTDPKFDGPGKLIAAPDGGLWFVNYGRKGPGSIGRFDVVTHQVVTVTDPALDHAEDVEVGPDNAVWFAADHLLGRVDLGTRAVSVHPLDAGIGQPTSLAFTPDGSLWFALIASQITPDRAVVGRFDRAANTFEISTTNEGVLTSTDALTVGPDGSLWFVADWQFGRFDPVAGTLHLYESDAIRWPSDLTRGPDGALWVMNCNCYLAAQSPSIARVDPTTYAVTAYHDPLLQGARSFTVGADDAFWIANISNVGRLVPPA